MRLDLCAVTLAFCTLSACGGSECPSGTVLEGERCVEVDAAGPGIDSGPRDSGPDAPGLDANVDAFVTPDAFTPDSGSDGGPCSRCPSETPACLAGATCVECTGPEHCATSAAGHVCDTSTHTCVECVGAGDCTGTDHACVSNQCVACDDRADCSAPTPACVSNACVQCDANTDCTSVGASRCDVGTNTCGTCTADADCSHLGATPVCDEGRGVCVQCTGDTEAARCGANSCRRSDGTCTTRMRGSRDVCDSCEADSECMAGEHCVRHVFSGTDLGGFCFLDAGGGCGNTVPALRPYRTPTDTTSIDGFSGMFCFPPSTTTCEGIRDTQSQACTMSTDCGDIRLPLGVDDGYCPTSGTGAGLCSYRCLGAVDCAELSGCAGAPQHCRPL
ncbi:MAG: hypothetical protein U0353_24365 [Sandaracinus sp.]